MSNHDRIDVERLRLPGFISRCEYVETIDSTNDAARRATDKSPAECGLLIAAERQTAGRGRGINRWWTGGGSLAFSVLFDPRHFAVELRYGCMTPLAAATAIVDVVLRRLPSPALGIHWPNDVYLGPRKLAGILVEALSDGRQIVGIGLNVNNSVAEAPPEIAGLVASLGDELGGRLDRTELLSELLEALDEAFTRLGARREELAAAADELCLQKGRVLTVVAGPDRTTGVCAGIAADGALLLDTAAGRRSVYSGIVEKP